MRRLLLCLVALAWPATIHAQDSQEIAPPSVQSFLKQPDEARWWLSGQVNLIGQAHGEFHSPYEGDHSLRSIDEHALSHVWTVYTGWRFTNRTEILFDLESASGRGISDAFGLAGYTNLDVVRNPTLGGAPYVARVMIHHVIPLSSNEVDVTRGPLSLFRRLPEKRLEIRFGKLGIVDFFDLNGPGSDSRKQFTNWTVDNNGAYDYDADTRGYTYGLVLELIQPRWTLRGAEALMPKVANGIDLDWNIARARGENVELELRQVPQLVSRTLFYSNLANMGSYDDAIAIYRAGLESEPDIVPTRRQGRRKYGIGQSVEYAFHSGPRLFGRAGWNDGRTESFAYTEVDSTLALGGDLAGGAWRRPDDRVGIAAVSNGLSGPHREYLRLGGLGFLLGDGNLDYRREAIVESYYTAHIWRGLFGAIGAQYIHNPGYNRDRGPVLVETARLHVEF